MDSGVTTIRCRIESAVDTAIGRDVSSQMKKRVLEIPDPQPRVKLEVQIEASQLLHDQKSVCAACFMTMTLEAVTLSSLTLR